MDVQTNGRAVPLAPDDRARMARLYEEIEGRLHEMALIAGRTLDMDLTEVESASLGRLAERSFSSVLPDPVEEKQKPFNPIRIVCTPTGCGCYDYNIGVCQPC